MPEVKGSFKQLCSALGARNVTEFNYRISNANKAHVFVGIQINSLEEAEKVADRLRRKKFDVLDLTADDLAKSHLRYMVGGHSSLAENEVLYRFEFPERPGALMTFLNTMNPEWNISLFHYRNQGADYGRVLVGIQVPPADKKAFREFLSTIGYPFIKETDNPAYKLFL
jgi:threonine dehydratase